MNNAKSIKGWVVYVTQLGRAAVVTGGRGRVGAVLNAFIVGRHQEELHAITPTDRSNDATFMVAEETCP